MALLSSPPDHAYNSIVREADDKVREKDIPLSSEIQLLVIKHVRKNDKMHEIWG